MSNDITINNHLVTDLRQIIEQGRRQAYISINASMIQSQGMFLRLSLCRIYNPTLSIIRIYNPH